ncbi:trehalose-phosphatase [Novosphingobium endophyticum]|nr:trehalose-phosphatase [Novosphingobium endophyticum]
MTDESEGLKLALHTPAQGDLPQPPPLRTLAQTAIFLDFDGTLVDIAARPDAVEVAHTLPALIERLDAVLGGRVALVSGRALAALDGMLGPLDVAMAGSHGGEFRPAAGDEVHPLADPLPEGIAGPLARFARDNGDLIVERKPFSMAVHYRGHAGMREPLLAMARDLAEDHGAGVKDGKMVVEVVMPGSDKGSAVAKFMEMPLFAGATPYFVGDDVTDEDAFRAVERFGGGGILVGAMRRTAARWRLDDVRAVHAWLSDALELAPPGKTDDEMAGGSGEPTG